MGAKTLAASTLQIKTWI